ncbi:MAG TPA: metallophosphoesterase [Acidobacteriota bacterium]|nr:metallophosphoesterase [Acidobacteriota bacterium]
MYSLVISDLHFGDPRCSLHSMRVARAFTERLREFTPLREVILLGDILDLQLANWAQAMEGRILDGPKNRAVGFRYFLNFLLQETGARSAVYVPGNHDYKIFDYHSVERYLLEPLRKGRKLSGKISFFRTFPNSFLQGILTVPDVRIRVVYPHYSIKIGKSRILLTHGHFFDPAQAFSHEVGKVFSKGSGLSTEEVRRLRHDYFRRVSLYQNVVSGFSMKKELRQLFSALYEPFTSIQYRIRHRTRKTFLTPATLRSIESYILFCCRRMKVDGLIFGHTHHSGSASLRHGPVKHVWNAGTFLHESPGSPDGSFILIQHDGKKDLGECVQVHEFRDELAGAHRPEEG